MTSIKALRHRWVLFIAHRRPIVPNKIITWNSLFRGFGDNPKYLVEYLCANEPGKYDIVWVYDREKEAPAALPPGVRAVPYFSLDYLREISTARLILSNIRTGSAHYFNKRNGQFYLQTWHSSLRLKKIELDAADALGEDYAKRAREDSEKCDLILSGCDLSTHIFENSFWYDGPVMKSGTPRCDILFGDTEALRKELCTALGVPPETNFVLYAPTFRDRGCDELHGIPAEALLEVLQKKHGGIWRFLYRLHPNLDKDIAPPCSSAINVSHYPDMQVLLASSALLITDYSSCMFDMALCRKPCMLYAPDLTDYLKRERELYFDITTLPFPLAQSPDALISAVNEFRPDDYIQRLDQFLAQIGSYEDGNACARIARKIESICFPKEE